MRVITKILDRIEGVRESALDLGADGVAMEHTGKARGVKRMNLPITHDTAEILFAAISIDDSLVKRKKQRTDGAMGAAAEEESASMLQCASTLQLPCHATCSF